MFFRRNTGGINETNPLNNMTTMAKQNEYNEHIRRINANIFVDGVAYKMN